MKINPIGTPLPSSGGQFLRMKKAGDKVQFRIAQEPVFEGKHFTPIEGGKWKVTSCARINDGDQCELCEIFFAGMAEAKKYEEAENKEKATACKNSIPKGCKPSYIYYFPILNRDTGKMAILQTTIGVKNRLDAEATNGVKVFDRDWVLSNTGKSKKDLYALSVVDSSETKEIEGEELAEFTKALNYDMMSIGSGSTVNDNIAETEEDTSTTELEKTEETEEIPF